MMLPAKNSGAEMKSIGLGAGSCKTRTLLVRRLLQTRNKANCYCRKHRICHHEDLASNNNSLQFVIWACLLYETLRIVWKQLLNHLFLTVFICIYFLKNTLKNS